jgi:hypothetical protein
VRGEEHKILGRRPLGQSVELVEGAYFAVQQRIPDLVVRACDNQRQI